MLGPYLSIYLSSPHLDLLLLLALLVREVLVVQPLAGPEASAVAELVIRARAVEGVSVRGLDWHLVDLPLVLLVLRRVSPRVLDAGVGRSVLESDGRTGCSRRSASGAVGAERVLLVSGGLGSEGIVETHTTHYTLTTTTS